DDTGDDDDLGDDDDTGDDDDDDDVGDDDTGDDDDSAEIDADSDGFTVSEGDCDDSDPAVYPGQAEVCDGVDNDCDPGTDEDDSADASTWYLDVDGDNYGLGSDTVSACEQPVGYAAVDGDCDDTYELTNPEAPELCDGLDNDCNDDTDEDDGPEASTWYLDGDGDDYGLTAQTVTACDQPGGYSAVDGDCDDEQDLIHPDADEICDDEDNDCDDSVDEGFDGDSDGYFDADDPGCLATYGALADCNDAAANDYPGAPERCDGVDNDCNGLEDSGDPGEPGQETDDDGDGEAECDGDCDDTDDDINSDADEILCDDVDNDCNDVVDDGAVDDEFFVKGIHEDSVELWAYDRSSGQFDSPETYNPFGLGTAFGAVAGDFDGDGYQDFITSREQVLGTNNVMHARLFRSDCVGGFDQINIDNNDGMDLWGLSDPYAAADLDNDGDLDVVGWDFFDGRGWTWLNEGDGVEWERIPSSTTGARPFDLSWHPNPQTPDTRELFISPPLDVTGDGFVDLVECSNQSFSIAPLTYCQVHEGLGTGSFDAGIFGVFVLSRRINGAAMADFNGDGLVDFIGGLDDDGDAGQTWIWLQDPLNPGNPSGLGVESFDVTPDPGGGLPDDNLPGYGWLYPYDWDADGDVDLVVSYQDPWWDLDRTLMLAVNDGDANFSLVDLGYTTHMWDFPELQDMISVPVWP
ncbi:MAG TPA: hypothetical protein DIU15_11880, partial [Deltaproteobacteria bacterium]|nr:hypothetical protein [Deltaproteobacteria bacterium]